MNYCARGEMRRRGALRVENPVILHGTYRGNSELVLDHHRGSGFWTSSISKSLSQWSDLSNSLNGSSSRLTGAA